MILHYNHKMEMWLMLFIIQLLQKKIKNLMQNLLLWTGIMRPYFQAGKEVATSFSVESLFAEYKTRLFKGFQCE